MKLSKTQKNFRKEMKQLKKEGKIKDDNPKPIRRLEINWQAVIAILFAISLMFRIITAVSSAIERNQSQDISLGSAKTITETKIS